MVDVRLVACQSRGYLSERYWRRLQHTTVKRGYRARVLRMELPKRVSNTRASYLVRLACAFYLLNIYRSLDYSLTDGVRHSTQT